MVDKHFHKHIAGHWGNCGDGCQPKKPKQQIKTKTNKQIKTKQKQITNKTKTNKMQKQQRDQEHDIYNVTDECNGNNPCQNNGTCQQKDGGYHCICNHGFTGKNCADKEQIHWEQNIRNDTGICTVNNPCQNNGTCKQKEKGYMCQCRSGFSGSNCEKIFDCTETPCQNGGFCAMIGSIMGINRYECFCTLGRTGKMCELEDPCHPNPCREGGTCSRNQLTGEMVCRCASGFQGQDCSEDVDECTAISPPCGNDLCVNTRGNFKCLPLPGKIILDI